ncbi:MAG: tyrosine--tRNA ligase [Bdellovibrionota bacterium]
MFKLSAEEQLKELKKGTVDCISEVELLAKLKESVAKSKPLRIKAGFDPSRPDLHIGHTVLLNKMRQFQEFGHHVIFLIGDFTAMIGDPTGKNVTRPALTSEEIQENAKTYARQVYKVLDEKKTEVAYNATWFNKFSAADFIRLTSQYTVARMLERDDFQKRYAEKAPISMHELLYPLVQGYDSVALKSDVELGGTDQKFNLLVGREIQKAYSVASQCVMTVPILEGLDGVQKMSKSLDNYIAVEDSPKDMFGKTMRVSDELMIRYFELLTDITTADLAKLQADLKERKLHPRQVKVDLAKTLVTRFHSKEAADNAEAEFNRIFVSGGLPDDMPTKSLNEGSLQAAALLVELQLATSKSEARRLIEGGAVEIIQGKETTGEKVKDHMQPVKLVKQSSFVVRAGKKKFVRVQVN